MTRPVLDPNGGELRVPAILQRTMTEACEFLRLMFGDCDGVVHEPANAASPRVGLTGSSFGHRSERLASVLPGTLRAQVVK
jgi:hypothetical protein